MIVTLIFRSHDMLRNLSLMVVSVFLATPAFAVDKDMPQIGHMVYFKLKDSNAANRDKLVEACNKYLGKHEGTIYYSAGTLGEEFKRDVNDREWDVALHLVFTDKAAYDKYAVHPEHLKFIEENKDTWAKVRVFDAEVKPTKK